MFLSLAIFESLSVNGELETFLVFPKDSPTVPVDTIRDLRGWSDPSEVDIGPLRFYADQGLRIKRIVAQLDQRSFDWKDHRLHIRLRHSGLPVAEHTTGYYCLLFPPGCWGPIHAHPHGEETVWISDTRRALFSTELWNHDRGPVREIGIEAEMRRIDGDPPAKIVASGDWLAGWGGAPNHGTVRNFLRAVNAGLSVSAPSTFICHSASDKEFARKLAVGLTTQGIRVWLDEAEIGVGDSLIEKIETGILGAQFLVVVLSARSVQSNWCKEELRLAVARQIQNKGIRVLPAVMEDCEIPGFLQEKRYADFRPQGSRVGHHDAFDAGLREIVDTVKRNATTNPVA